MINIMTYLRNVSYLSILWLCFVVTSVSATEIISAGGSHTCAIKSDGTAACWGDNSKTQASPPEDVAFSQISAGYEHTCGVRTDGRVMCWGDGSLGDTTPPSGNFIQVNAGNISTCGIKTDGKVIC